MNLLNHKPIGNRRSDTGVPVSEPCGTDPIENVSLARQLYCMLRRAAISFATALVAAGWGFSGLFPVTGTAGKMLFFAAVGFLLLSLLFSLFEETPEEPSEKQVFTDWSEQPLSAHPKEIRAQG